MRTITTLLLVPVVCWAVASPGTALSRELNQLGEATRPEIPHADDHVLVKLKPGASAAEEVGPASEHVFDRWHRMPVTGGRSPMETVQMLAQRPGVELAELDYTVHLGPSAPVAVSADGQATSADPLAGSQWHFPPIQVPESWEQATGDGVVVAILDTGISQGGEDLDCHTFVHPFNAITGTAGLAAANDDNGHGTHVAGTVAQCTNNDLGVAGVAFNAALMPVKVLDSFGAGDHSSLAAGIDWAREHGADVINLSLGCDSCTSSITDEAISAAVDAGVVLVAASGNSNSGQVSYPASHPDVISVGAVDYNLIRAPYSNGGTELDLVAPGGDNSQDANEDGNGDGVLQETFVDGFFGYYFGNGTSMAAPHVSGAVALLLSVAPGADLTAINSALRATAIDLGPSGHDTSYGHGLIQVRAAIEYLTSPDSTPLTWPGWAKLAISGLTGTEADLTWPDANDDGSLTGYRVYRDGAEVATVGKSTNSLSVTGLTPATTYTFEVKAEDSSGNMGPPLAASASTVDSIVPTWGSSAELRAKRYGQTHLTLEWKGAVDNVGVTGYRLRILDTDLVASSSATSTGSATVKGLEPGQSYFFEVMAGDAAGNWSEPLSAVFRTLTAFTDISGHLFYDDILWMADVEITRGCNPPTNDLFCPDDPVTRETMAAFLVRALGLTANNHPGFADVVPGSTFANDIGKLATAGITKGCDPPLNDRFCPKEPVTRATMAAFLVRAFELTKDNHPGFKDVSSSSIFAHDIERLATAGITRGCNPPANDLFCPGNVVTRGQLAAFLHRALP